MRTSIITYIVTLSILVKCCLSQTRSLEVGRNNYEYILPTRKVISCPSFASFRFSCQKNHVIAVDSVIFSPPAFDSSANTNDNCIADWISDCIDNGLALQYAQQECSNSESCTLISYTLKSKTKCEYNQIISVLYKCVPTWEVTDVPVKCDICKNITITNIRDTYGFIHSAWYPRLYPRVVCHSLLKNQADKLIVIYSVSGSIGLDRIQIESVNERNELVVRETLTGNLTTRLVLVSDYDVNVTVLPEDAYFNDHRRFLLYFYLIPKCQISACFPNHTITHPPTAVTFQTGYPNGSTFAPPLVGIPTNIHNNTNKISDAWLAAILALVYSLLMVVAVLVALYYRRRQKKKLDVQQTNMSNRSSSHIIPASLSRASSVASLSHHRPTYIPTFMAAPNPQYSYNIEEAHNHQQESSDLKVQRYIRDQEELHEHQQQQESLYRAVEFTKSPKIERVRAAGASDQSFHSNENVHTYKIDAHRMTNESSIVSGQGVYGECDEKAFVVKLYPLDEHEKEIQEMTMYVESNEQITTTTHHTY